MAGDVKFAQSDGYYYLAGITYLTADTAYVSFHNFSGATSYEIAKISITESSITLAGSDVCGSGMDEVLDLAADYVGGRYLYIAYSGSGVIGVYDPYASPPDCVGSYSLSGYSPRHIKLAQNGNYLAATFRSSSYSAIGTIPADAGSGSVLDYRTIRYASLKGLDITPYVAILSPRSWSAIAGNVRFTVIVRDECVSEITVYAQGSMASISENPVEISMPTVFSFVLNTKGYTENYLSVVLEAKNECESPPKIYKTGAVYRLIH